MVTAKPKALGYVRVSTQEQVAGFGLDIQEDAIRAYSKANGYRLVRILRDEGVSGSNGLEERLGLAEALAALKGGEASILVVYRIDRLARDLILQETLVERLRDQGTPVRSASEPDLDTDTDDPTKILIRQIVGAVSQYERAIIRGRLKSGKAAKKAAGGFVGGRAPYGFKVERKEVVPDEDEQQVVELARKLHGRGKSLREIGAELDRKGLRPRDGERWHPNTVRRIVMQPPRPTPPAR